MARLSAQRCCVQLPFHFTGYLRGLSISPLTKLPPVSAGRLHRAALRAFTGEGIDARITEPPQARLLSERRPLDRTITADAVATILILLVIEIVGPEDASPNLVGRSVI